MVMITISTSCHCHGKSQKQGKCSEIPERK